MTTSESIEKLAAALVQVQATAGPALKQSNNPAFRSKYADLSAVWEAVREPLAKAGVAVVQEAVLTDLGVAVSTRLIHASGQWLETEPLTVPLNKRDAHGVGSGVSYGKRYSLSAALGVVADDDDGNAAVGTAPAKAAPPAPPAGLEAFKASMEKAAGDGLEALQTAWKGSDATLRDYVNTVETSWWNTTKMRASKGAK